ncbi:MAG: AMP-binding protein [Thiovulaceae bacterium]|nr:AMP-binding protein [Sulfurimonadaceae bacterium]
MTYPYENLENFTMKDLFERSVALYGEKNALGFISQTPLTYAQMAQQVSKISLLLQEHGIRKGDKVALLSENMPNWGVAYLSISIIGAIVVPILPDFHPSEVKHILRHSEAKGVFVSLKYYATIEESHAPELEFAINIENLEFLEDFRESGYLAQLKQKVKEKIHNHHAPHGTTPHEDDICAIIYTSGTTGHSKGVMLSHKNIVTNAMSTHSVVKITPDDVFFSVLPLAHTFECTVGFIVPLLHGACVYYSNKAPTPSVLLRAFESVKPTMMLSVPLIIEKIYKNKVLSKMNESFWTRNLYKVPLFRKQLNKIAGKKLLEVFGGRLKFYGIGGAALPAYVEEFLHEASFPYVVGYGLTETAPLLAGTPMNKPTKVRSTGPAMYGVELKIKDPDPKTGLGEICAKSPSIMKGYYKDEEKTKEVFDEEGWFLTGDLGSIDEDGYLFIRGRSKNVIVGPSGENIYPEQIESIINQHELVLESLVLEADGKLVARIHLDYELIDKMFESHKNSDAHVKEEITKLLETMRIEFNTQLASFNKLAKCIEQIEPFVKTPTKKIKRYLYTH